MTIDVCKCPNCSESLSDIVEEYDNQEILPKEKKIFICPRCKEQVTFEKLYSYTVILAILILALSVLIQIGCIVMSGECSFKENLNIVNIIIFIVFGFLVYLNKWIPRLKIYKS